MVADSTFFHHVGLITRDMDRTIVRYQQLGFLFTPLSLPRISLAPGRAPEPFGAGNRTAIFEVNYLEVLAHTDMRLWNQTTPEQRGPYDIDRPLARYEGMHVMHFGSHDLVGLHDRLVSHHVQCTDIKPFERNVDTLPRRTLKVWCRWPNISRPSWYCSHASWSMQTGPA